MLGELAAELIRESARTADNASLGHFAEDRVRAIIEETKALFDQNQREIAAKQHVTTAVHVRHATIERNKRCLLAYINSRMEKIKSLRWEFGAVLPPEVRSQLCEPEVEFFRRYGSTLATYMKSIGDGAGLDLMADMHPPKSLYIQVRCIQDYGEMETDDGDVIVLKKNTLHFLPRNLCEPLVRQGVLQHISS